MAGGADQAPTTPVQHDPQAIGHALRGWLAARWPHARDLRITDVCLPQGAGGSNETFLCTATWRDDRRAVHSEGLVVRLAPTGFQIFLEADIGRQYAVLDHLAEHGDVPVPSLHGLEPDAATLGAPFWVMSRVDGVVPSDFPPYNQAGFLVEATPAERERLWLSAMEAFTAIHRVEIGADTAAFRLLDRPERGTTGIDQELEYWRLSMERAVADVPDPTVTALWEWLLTHRPAARPTGLSWGDARMGNMIFDGFRCVAVLDWEMVSLAGGLADLGWWLCLDLSHSEDLGVPRLDGLGSRAATIAFWEERTGQHTADLEWHEAFAGLRLAVILLRAVAIRRSLGAPLPGPGEFGNLETLTARLARTFDLHVPSA
ncbi:Aminoglycoside phosphotransferase [Frankia canadensis]|uniref:Aminoglycoside phosphotransferase n=1 Tax=Frankia canadensis TaxID=1836972 RepID=A0A2I2KJE5_9ACTN|nr:phosphotransferase family protein [Frankia canadensis]SNQ45780.1 Aminoglycoside phosphotransferase [Frankia canadensis]SOU53070.1 Aminoglycoside phosphotransferase [Frankia canadensis]